MKTFARLFLPIFTLWLVMFPATTYAVPNTFRIGSTFYSKSAAGYGLVAVDAIAAVGAVSPWVGVVVTGYQIGKLVLNAMDSSGNPAGVVNVMPSGVQQTYASGSVPVGWSIDSNGNAYPPVNASVVVSYTGSGVGTIYSLPNADQCHTAANISLVYWVFASLYETPTYVECVWNATPVGLLNGAYNGFHSGSFNKISSCPAGYTLSGGACNLTNVISVMFPSDGVPSYQTKADGSGFLPDPRDPDTTNAPVMTSPTTIKGLDTQNNPLQITITPLTGGGVSVESFKQTLNPDGSTTTFRQKVTTGSDGKVTDTQSGNYPGSIPQQAGTPLQQPSSPSLSVNFPTDYNREATQQGIKTDLDAIKTSLDPAEVPAALDTGDMQPMTDAKAARDGLVSDIGALPAAPDPVTPATLLQPFTPAACSPLSYTFGSAMTAGAHTVTLNLCPYVPTIQSIGAWAMYLLTAAMLFQMFTRRPEGMAD